MIDNFIMLYYINIIIDIRLSNITLKYNITLINIHLPSLMCKLSSHSP